MAIKTGTKIGIAALALAVGTAMYWFCLTSEVALPEDRTGFVIAWLSAAALGLSAYFKGVGILGALIFSMADALGIGLVCRE